MGGFYSCFDQRSHCEWDQGGLLKSVFLQAGAQSSQEHPEPLSGLQAETELYVLFQQRRTGFKLSPSQVDSPLVSLLVSAATLYIAERIYSHSLLCAEWKAPNTDFKIAPKLDIYHNNGGERVLIRWSIIFILLPVNHLTPAGSSRGVCQIYCMSPFKMYVHIHVFPPCWLQPGFMSLQQ